MPDTSASSNLPAKSTWRQIVGLLKPHWKALSLAFVAVLGETITDLLDPWPLKIIIDNLLQSKPLPPRLAAIVSHLAGQNQFAVLKFALVTEAEIDVERGERW
jgi:subfamily B ATP-binding cassette protein MsbA